MPEGQYVSPVCGPSAAEPQLAIIIPTFGDDRGVLDEVLDAWLAQQDAGERSALFIVSDGRDPSSCRRMQRRLRAVDRLLIRPGLHEAALYNVGAAATTADWLLFTESHCIPAPNAVAKLMQHLTRTGEEIVVPGCVGISSNRLATFEDQHAYEETAGAPRPWRNLSLRGLAIRRQRFWALGGLDESARRFSETVLAIELHSAGMRLSQACEAILQHVNSDTLANISENLRGIAVGQCTWWRRVGTARASAYLPPPPGWAGHGRLHGPTAWAALRAAARGLWPEVGRPNWRAKAFAAMQELPGLAFAALTGSAGALAAAWVYEWAARLLWHLAPATSSSFMRYRRYVQTCTRTGVMEFLTMHAPPAAPDFSGTVILRVGEADDSILGDFHPPERWGREPFRWSAPVGTIRFRRQPAATRITVRTLQIPDRSDPCVRFFFNQRVIAPKAVSLHAGNFVFDVPCEWFKPGEEQHLILTCVPVSRVQMAPGDRRRLGLAVTEVLFEDIPARPLRDSVCCGASFTAGPPERNTKCLT